MNHESVLKRADGTRVKIIIRVECYRGKFGYVTEVLTCKKGKRTWKKTYDHDSYEYRGLSMDQREEFKQKSFLTAASPEEILKEKTKLWQKLKPDL